MTQVHSNDPTSTEDRINALIQAMSLEEKVAQMNCVRARWFFKDEVGPFDPEKAAEILKNGAGACDPRRLPIREFVEFTNAVQRILREKSRHGIPILFQEEACHGILAPEATSFPAPIGLACSWDTDLVGRVFTVVAAEMRSRGMNHALTPILDINYEPRWGRTDEMMGEDPYLNGKLATAMVRALQGDDPNHIGEGKVATTLKHLAGHGVPESGVNRAPAHMGLRELYQFHLAPFREVLANTHAATVMPSYNEIDGLPCHANRWLIQDLLRKEMGFDRLVISDYHGIMELFTNHHVVTSDPEAALRAFKVGIEMDLPLGEHYAHLPQLVREGKIAESDIDESVRRILRLKFNLGLFDENYEADAEKAEAIAKLDSSKALAREAAQKSIVLLKNKDNFLPLAKDRYKTIAVIGPHADDTRLGSYSGEPFYRVSIFEGIKQHVGDSANVVYSKGCALTSNEGSPRNAWEKVRKHEFPNPEDNEASIAQAVESAKQSDLIVLVLGENELIGREAWASDHIGDRASLDLFGAQNKLADEIFKLEKPVVVYLMNGRPLAIPHIVERAEAVLEGWYAGQETGNAAADIIFGVVNPSGKLTMTIPRFVGQLPLYYNQKPSAHVFPYMDFEHNTPLFPFGFGLSYTTFAYEDPQLSANDIQADGKTEVQVKITNTGSRHGDEIVQLYIYDKVASVTRPRKELKGFRRVSLAPGASETVTFSITPDLLSFYNEDLKCVVEPGEFDIIVGPSSVEGKSVTLRVAEAH